MRLSIELQHIVTAAHTSNEFLFCSYCKLLLRRHRAKGGDELPNVQALCHSSNAHVEMARCVHTIRECSVPCLTSDASTYAKHHI